MHSYLVFLDEVDEGSSLDFHRLSLFVVQRQHEVEEVGLAQVRRRLFLEVCTRQGDAKTERLWVSYERVVECVGVTWTCRC